MFCAEIELAQFQLLNEEKLLHIRRLGKRWLMVEATLFTQMPQSLSSY